MDLIFYLLIALIVAGVAYTLYRQFYLKDTKKRVHKKPHFTLKIEPE